MVEFKARQHRLEIPPAPKSDDPATQKKYSNDLRRLVMDEFNRLASDFHDFKQATYNAGVIPLRGVANIAVTFDRFSMSAIWENPQQDEITPTHVRVRIKEITPNAWAEYAYPISAWQFNGLQPNTQYTLEVQLVARFEATDTFVSTTRNCPSVPVLRTAESDIKAKVFRTLTGVGAPISTTANDTNIIFTFPTTNGTPGAVNSTLCWWGYKFQFAADCTWADTAVSEAFAAGNVGNVTINTAAAPFTTRPNAVYRLAYREICNAVPQPWVFGSPFTAANFASANCVGIIKSASKLIAPYDTADLFVLPQACQSSGSGITVVDDLTKNQFARLAPGFGCIEFVASEWTLIGADTANAAVSNLVYRPMIAGQIPLVGGLAAGSDFTIAMDINVLDNTLVLRGGTGSYPILKVGKKINVNFVGNTSTYDITVTVPREGGGSYLFRANGCLYGAWNSIFYVHDVSEPDGRQLYLNSVLADRSSNAIANDFDGITTDVELFTMNKTRIRKVYGWNSAVIVVNTVPYQGWAFSQASPPTRPASVTDINVGDVVFVTSVYRGIGPGNPGAVAFNGSATMSARATIVGANELRFDSLGVSDGRAWVYAAVCTVAGTFSATGTTTSFVIVPGLETAGATNVAAAYGRVTNTISEGDGTIVVTPGAATGNGYRKLHIVVGGGDGAATFGYLVYPPFTNQINVISVPLGELPDTAQWTVTNAYTNFTYIYGSFDPYSTATDTFSYDPPAFTSGGLAVCTLELISD